MQTKKILGVSLCAALITSMAAASVSARDSIPTDELPWVVANHSYSAIGTFTDWSSDIDISDADGDGIYTGVITGLEAGEYSGKVRADHDWTDSWGGYNDEKEQNYDGPDIAFTVAEGQDVKVTFDTTVDSDLDDENYLMWTVSFEAVDAQEEEEQYKPFTTLGVIGAFNGWSADEAMTDEDGDGVYEATITITGESESADHPGTTEFKIRADGAWDFSWGEYEVDNDRTQNSQTNCSVAFTNGDTVKVKVQLDTTKVDARALANADSVVNEDDFVFATDGFDFWPVNYEVVDEGEESKEESSKEESSKEESSKEESSKTEQKTTVLTDYVYFDNSETKWDVVYAYWWESSYARTYDLEDNDYGWIVELDENGEPKVTEDGVVCHVPLTFPGTKMTQVPGTDIWQVRIPFGAQKIIFNSGKNDEQIKVLKEKGYQTADLSFDPVANAGQVYVVDAVPTTEDPDDKKANPKPGRGVEKTKYTYERGEWKDYTGEFVSETIGGETETSTETSTGTSVVTPDTSTVKPDDGNVKTGDATMPIAVAAVAVAALGVVVFAAKKKSSEE